MKRAWSEVNLMTWTLKQKYQKKTCPESRDRNKSVRDFGWSRVVSSNGTMLIYVPFAQPAIGPCNQQLEGVTESKAGVVLQILIGN